MVQIDVIYYAKLAIYTALVVSLPVMAVSFVVGLLVGVFQSLTQIQDQTFAFIAKLVAVVIVLFVSMPLTISRLTSFIEIIYSIK